MSKPDVTLINNVSVSGFLNGVVNLSLTQLRFVARVGEDGSTKVETVGEVAADLRFDLYCAQQIRDALDAILAQHTRPKTEVN